ncbi:MAG: tetratricopeptide repeat protein [Pseudomonadota bacterium]|nr:tetratricopeptide repeat protein [Pseudomonadota bacterium]
MNNSESGRTGADNAAGRERGIIASQVKLHQAMANAGIHSKTELARKIQDIEGLDKLPRSLVSRVFSQPVDLKSLERVANALSCPSWTLYSSAEDLTDKGTTAVPAHEPDSTLSETRGFRWKPMVMFGIIAIALMSVIAYQVPEQGVSQESDLIPSSDGLFDHNVVAVMPIAGDDNELTYTHMLEDAVAGVSDFLPGSAFRYSAAMSPPSLISEQKAELVITGELIETGKFVLIRLSLYDEDGMSYFWSGHFSATSSPLYISRAIKSAIENVNQGIASAVTPSWEDYKLYTGGLSYLDGERNEAVLLKLSDILHRVLRQAPDFADAHATLCNVLVQKHIFSGEKSYLQEADEECQRARILNDSSPTVLTASAVLARKAGDPEAAAQYLEQLFLIDPDNTAGLQLLAEVEVQRFRQTGDEQYIKSAELALIKAIDLDPQQWKFPFTLARVYFFTGQVEKAIYWSGEAVNDWEGLETLTNLGTYQFCHGDLASARNTYESALVFSPDHPVITSNLATLYYYLGQYEDALNFYQQLESKEPQKTELYQYWVNEADTFYHLDKIDKARALYLKSLDYLDSVLAKGEANDMQKAVRISVYVRLIKIDETLASPALIASLKKEALELEDNQDMLTRFHLSLSWLNMGDEARAIRLKKSIEGSCPGFVASPDFTI